MLKLKKTQWIFLVMLVILTVMLSCEKKDLNKEPSIDNMGYDSPPIPYGDIGILTIDNDPTGKNNKIAIQLRAGVLIDRKGVVKNIGSLTVTQKMGKIFTIMNMSRDNIYNAIKNTKFKPAIKNNKPINAYVQIPIQIEFDRDMYLAALNSVNENITKNITVRSKVKSKVNFIPYDTPPKPIGGKKAILENIVYPKKEKEAKVEGIVVIQAFVNEHGVVSDWEIFQGILNTGLNEAAIDAIKKTKFKPATKDKKPVGVWIAVPINFKLEKDNDKKKDSKVKFVEYDTPPKPIGGKKAILENIIYPKKAKEAKIEGTVVIQAFVNEEGIITDCVVFRGIPNTGLNEAAIEAIKKTKFTPAAQKGEPVGVWIAIPINFKLKK